MKCGLFRMVYLEYGAFEGADLSQKYKLGDVNVGETSSEGEKMIKDEPQNLLLRWTQRTHEGSFSFVFCCCERTP